MNLCLRHLQQAADWYHLVVNDRQRLAAAIDTVFDPAAPDRPTRVAHNVVYFVRFRDLVKIGTTGNLVRRLRHLTFDELLCALPGDRTTEALLHRRFAHLKVRGEWFQDAPAIRDFITAAKRNQEILGRNATQARCVV